MSWSLPPVSLKLFALALLGFVTPAFAQATGPSGLAEPKLPKPGKLHGPVAIPGALVTPPLDPANTWNIQLSTGGIVSIQLRPDQAPKSVERVKTLVGRHFYDGLTFHRVIDGFMAQGGDPKGTGEGGSDLPNVPSEFNPLPHVRGAVAMARADDPNSANSQFYIMLAPNLTLDRHYTVIGRVTQGMAYADLIEKGEPPANPTRIVRSWIGAVPADAATPPVARAAASAAADTAATQAAQAAVAAQDAAAAAKAGQPQVARERATAAQVAAGGAAQAANDAAAAAGTAQRKRKAR
jgi:cyclophilin family peptidyl-prolyl cis-trans isomerase